MSGFLQRLAERALGVARPARPFVPSRFAPESAFAWEGASEADDSESHGERRDASAAQEELLVEAPAADGGGILAPTVSTGPAVTAQAPAADTAPPVPMDEGGAAPRVIARRVRGEPLPRVASPLRTPPDEPTRPPPPAPAAAAAGPGEIDAPAPRSDADGPNRTRTTALDEDRAQPPASPPAPATPTRRGQSLEPAPPPDAWTSHAAPTRTPEGSPGPTAPAPIQITIGRVEVRAVLPAEPRPTSSRPQARPPMPLDEYLRQRDRGER